MAFYAQSGTVCEAGCWPCIYCFMRFSCSMRGRRWWRRGGDAPDFEPARWRVAITEPEAVLISDSDAEADLISDSDAEAITLRDSDAEAITLRDTDASSNCASGQRVGGG